MNVIHIAGYLGGDAETRVTASGRKVTSFSLASRAGRDETIWWQVDWWGENNMTPYLKKGSAVIVIADLRKPAIYTDRDGNPQVSMKVSARSVLFSPFGRSSKEGEENKRDEAATSEKEVYSGFTAGEGGSPDQTEDDIPF